MKILHVHNFYRMQGGEDTSLRQETQNPQLEIALFAKHSLEIESLAGKVRAVFSAVYSPASRREAAQVLRDFQPDIMHVHNLYPLLSPSVLLAAKDARVPVVMTCHNYRLVCPIAVHFRGGKICEDCAGGREHWCMLHNCRNNRVESAAYAFRNAATRMLGLYRNHVDMFIAISAYVGNWLQRSGFEASRIRVVYNGACMPASAADASQGTYGLYVGRLSEEKGVETLLRAAALLPECPVHVVGDGPLRESLQRMAPPNVTFLGALSSLEVAEAYRGARFSVVPSLWQEGFGFVAIEAMGHGIPVIASRRGALPEIIEEGASGSLFEAGDAAALAGRMRQLWSDPALCQQLGHAARVSVCGKFSEETHLQNLMNVYQEVLGQ